MSHAIAITAVLTGVAVVLLAPAAVRHWRASARVRLRPLPTSESINVATEDEAWLADHRRRVAQFPPDIRRGHKHSSNHREEIVASTACGCFYCLRIFAPNEIQDWVDPADDNDDEGTTALCPFCGIDAVIADCSGFPVTLEFLTEMHKYWF
jgi:hypothetical protein